ncbi:PREDICTED: membrane-spanning 4-domains subfamily A member 12-like isoform X3 [Lepidothrix coronata]|uniref:Membrane-spanning 4-domains subfamily A member 12-like isoform X3 n=1 Tax=Lepidothrix coronata TaxID=321398 RepID=A0A6J0J688_9PASS|nr:PREDICTED: membrane-spanning 4-domains subfamily A member 12-like isoform X3 [Lepidothrix coronata]
MQPLTSRRPANGRRAGRGVAGGVWRGRPRWERGCSGGVPAPPDLSMQGMGSLRLGNRAVMYTAETLSKGKNRVMGTIQIMTGFLHIGFGIVLTTLTSLYTSVFVIGEIPFLGGVSFIISGCLSIGAEKSPTECAVKGSQTMNVISAIFALLGIVAFIVDLNLNVLYHSSLDYHGYLVLLAGNGISIVLLIFTVLEFCIAVATANFWCRATRLSSNELAAPEV